MTRNENIYAQDSIFSKGAINRLPIFCLCLVGPYQGSDLSYCAAAVPERAEEGLASHSALGAILGALVEVPEPAWPC